MNGKAAKKLRKLTGYDHKAPRIYDSRFVRKEMGVPVSEAIPSGVVTVSKEIKVMANGQPRIRYQGIKGLYRRDPKRIQALVKGLGL